MPGGPFSQRTDGKISSVKIRSLTRPDKSPHMRATQRWVQAALPWTRECRRHAARMLCKWFQPDRFYRHSRVDGRWAKSRPQVHILCGEGPGPDLHDDFARFCRKPCRRPTTRCRRMGNSRSSHHPLPLWWGGGSALTWSGEKAPSSRRWRSTRYEPCR